MRDASPARWLPLALAVFALGVATAYAPLWHADPREQALASVLDEEIGAAPGRGGAWRHTTYADTLFAAWLVPRNAATLLRRPHRLHHTEHCAPARRTIALGESMLTMGVLAVPFWLVTGDAVLTYNLTLLAIPLIGALAMFLLVSDWTRAPAAGIVAGLLYAFHPILLKDVTHPFIYDLSWTLLALFFARRLFARGRWRDAVGLAASCSLQLGASFYPLLAAVFFAPPLVVWLLVHYRLRNVRPAQLALVALVVGLAAAVVFFPYLALRSETDLLRRSTQSYVSWITYLPGYRNFPGWLSLPLALAAFALGRRRCLAGLDGDPRWALLAGGLLVALAAAGGNHNAQAVARLTGEPPPLPLPDLYAALGALVPGLDAVRVVALLALGVHLAVSIFAGLGAAALLRLVPPRFGAAAAAALIALSAVEVLRPAWLGFAPRLRFEPVVVRPPREEARFYAELARLGNTGPIAEVPPVRTPGYLAFEPIALTLEHGRRTSACFGSYVPPERTEVERIMTRLPAADAVEALGRLGFTTIVARDLGVRTLRERLARAAARGDAPLRHLYSDASRSAFEILPREPRGPVVDSTRSP